MSKTASYYQQKAAQQLREAGIESAALDARLLLQHALSLSREDIVMKDPELTDPQQTLYEAFIVRRTKNEPVAKIIGKKAFWKYEFITTADTLDPRPDSETLIEATLTHRPPATAQVKRILDLGTGTGCLVLSLLGEYAEATGLGVDASEAALKIAQQNAEALNMSSRLQLQRGNWLHGLDETFDIIITNPPYIAPQDKAVLDPDVVNYDPHDALFADNNGLSNYEAILQNVRTFLAKGGLLVVEAGLGQAEAIKRLGKRGEMHPVATVKDSGAVQRAILFESLESI